MDNKLVQGRKAAMPAVALGAGATGTFALGAIAVGAFAVGALALGALAIGRLFLGRVSARQVRIQSLVVEDLTVRKLRLLHREDREKRGAGGLTGHGMPCRSPVYNGFNPLWEAGIGFNFGLTEPMNRGSATVGSWSFARSFTSWMVRQISKLQTYLEVVTRDKR